MIVVDSSGWVEFFTDGALADEYAKRLRTLSTVLTPVIVLYEVYKRLVTSDVDFEGIADVTYLPKKVTP